VAHIVTISVDGGEIRQIEVDIRQEGWEQRMVESLEDIRREIVGAVLAREDAALAREVPAGWVNLGRECRQVVTLAGKVVLVRRVFRDEEGQRRKPLDEALGLSRYRRDTSGLLRFLAYWASGVSYRRAAELSSWAIGEHITCMRVQRAVWEVGRALLCQEEAQRAAVFARGKAPSEGQIGAAIVYCEADGVWLSLQREAMRGAEVRVAVLYSGKQAISASRYCLENRITVTRLGCSSQEWQETLLLEVFRHFSLDQIKTLVLSGDGAPWVRHSLDRLERPVIYQLDRFHLFRAARQTSPAAVPLARTACQTGWDGVKDALQDLIVASPDQDRHRLLNFQRYLHNNASGLLDYRLRLGLDSRRYRGLGAIEGNVDKLVVQRMKGRGMSWRLPGARAMLAVCRHRDALQAQSLPLGGYGYRRTPRLPGRPPRRRPAPREETWLHASVPLLHSQAENSPLGQALRHAVNGYPGLSA